MDFDTEKIDPAAVGGRDGCVDNGDKAARSTPPRELSSAAPNQRSMPEAFIFQKSEMIPIKSPDESLTKKRPFDDSGQFTAPRKVYREKRTSPFSKSYSLGDAQPKGPSVTAPMPQQTYIPQPPKGRTSSSASTGLHRSFGSTTSFRSSQTGQSTGRTTPNTSMTTSFDSSYDQSDPTISLPKSTHLQQEIVQDLVSSCSLHRPELGVMHSNMFPDNDIDLESMNWDVIPPFVVEQHKSNMSIPNEAITPNLSDQATKNYVQAHLFEKSPFGRPNMILEPSKKAYNYLVNMTATEGVTIPFRQLYEVIRVATSAALPSSKFTECLKQCIDDYDLLWSKLAMIVKSTGNSMPERSNPVAWVKAETRSDSVALSGSLKYNEKINEPLLRFELKPLKLDSTYRLSRKYGSDRFCVVSIAGIDRVDYPAHLKHAGHVVRSQIVRWLVDEEHYFVGRKWRAFYVKADQPKKSQSSKVKSKPGFRIFFFAEDGYDFEKQDKTGELDPRKLNHKPQRVEDVIEWFMPLMENKDQTALKLFARLRQAASSTRATVEFWPREIIRCDNARSDDPKQWSLDIRRSDDKKRHLRPDIATGKVMNDGCARISRTAAEHVAKMQGLDYIPSAFQGRIGGAKGVWMVDLTNESLPQKYDRGYWIEINDSQLKFIGHSIDQVSPDPPRMTFEVQSQSKPLIPSALNFQLIPILADRGVPYPVFKQLLEEDLTAKVAEMEAAMDNPMDLFIWNQENSPVIKERLATQGIEMFGAIPYSESEKINWFLRHGFDPKSCRFFKDLLYRFILEHCLRLENRMHIGLGRSTTALMIADPLAILEEGEVHIGFSNTFRDSKSGWSGTMLHNCDLLVARLPAHLPSDIQRVRAIFKLELEAYRDVIVFPSRGSCPLAEQLSGGDYDGDRAWICWEPEIVTPFCNAAVPEALELEAYDIKKDMLKVSDLVGEKDCIPRFLRHGFDFNLQPNLLGPCTYFHESLCYDQDSINEPSAITIALLLGNLVDRAKAGIIFKDASWSSFLRKLKISRQCPRPAYRDKNRRPKDHLIDNLVFKVAKGIREDALGKFANRFQHVSTHDDDLVRPWKQENEAAKDDVDLQSVLSNLKNKLKIINNYWRENNRRHDEFKPSGKDNEPSLLSVVEKCRADFLAIEPLPIEGHPLVKRWRTKSSQSNAAVARWDLLKASALYDDFRSGSFPWYVAGVELGELKATAKGKGSYGLMTMEILAASKLDIKTVRRRQRADAEQSGIEDDDYGSDIDMDDIGEAL